MVRPLTPSAIRAFTDPHPGNRAALGGLRHLAQEWALEIGERIGISGDFGIVRTVEPLP
jgi:hypothetical protein